MSQKFVFSHEGSYCPWFELADGSGQCYQFFEGNDGWAELFNQFGRQERNSFVDVIEDKPERVWIRWIYFGVNQDSGAAAYRGVEDFWIFPSGLVLRRQTYHTLMPGDHRGYAREPIETIAMCPVGKLWKDILQTDEATQERHALMALDPFSANRYDVYWKPAAPSEPPAKIWQATARRAGCDWKQIDDAKGVVLAIPMKAGTPFCIFGEASGYPVAGTRIKEHSHKDTGGIGWISTSWDHWPIGWLNSQAHEVDATTLDKYPNHFSPSGMDFFAMKNEDVERGVYWSIDGVAPAENSQAGGVADRLRALGKEWLTDGHTTDPDHSLGFPVATKVP